MTQHDKRALMDAERECVHLELRAERAEAECERLRAELEELAVDHARLLADLRDARAALGEADDE